MRYILAILLLFSLVGPLTAQSEDDKVIFKAMQDEMERNKKEIVLPDMQRPFFLSYALGRFRQFDIVGVLGGITRSFVSDNNATGGVQLMLGDYDNTSDVAYIGMYAPASAPAEVDYLGIRRGFWAATDIMYKYALQYASAKEAYLKANPQTAEEAALPDLQKLEPIQKIVEPKEPFTIDRQQLEGIVKELSAIFVNYKEIYNTSVGITGVDMEIYRQTTDGVSVKQPSRFVQLYARGTVTTDEGEKLSDTYSVLVKCPQNLPALEELKKEVTKFAEGLIEFKNAPKVDEFYSGPVLFVDGAASSVFTYNLLNKSGLIAYRKPAMQAQAVRTLDDRMGKKIIDSRLTVKNYSTLDKYNGEPLLGAYEIDAEGVIPAKEMTLVENGILKALLNGGVPSLKAPLSTGSSRYLYNGIAYVTAPGTIHIQVEKGLKPEKMKKELIKAAKEEGLDYAYIVRRSGSVNSLLYRVDVKDGKETMMRTADVAGIALSKIKRVREISSKENVMNYILNGEVLSSLIYPSSILIEDVEIGKVPVKTEKEPVLKYPLQRD